MYLLVGEREKKRVGVAASPGLPYIFFTSEAMTEARVRPGDEARSGES